MNVDTLFLNKPVFYFCKIFTIICTFWQRCYRTAIRTFFIEQFPELQFSTKAKLQNCFHRPVPGTAVPRNVQFCICSPFQFHWNSSSENSSSEKNMVESRFSKCFSENCSSRTIIQKGKNKWVIQVQFVEINNEFAENDSFREIQKMRKIQKKRKLSALVRD